MTATEVRAAAALMRRRAHEVQWSGRPGPWLAVSLGHGFPQPVYVADERKPHGCGVMVADAYGDPHTAIDVARYLAAMSPGFALATAAMLDSASQLPWSRSRKRALAVARAYLGTSGDALAEVGKIFGEPTP